GVGARVVQEVRVTGSGDADGAGEAAAAGPGGLLRGDRRGVGAVADVEVAGDVDGDGVGAAIGGGHARVHRAGEGRVTTRGDRDRARVAVATARGDAGARLGADPARAAHGDRAGVAGRARSDRLVRGDLGRAVQGDAGAGGVDADGGTDAGVHGRVAG